MDSGIEMTEFRTASGENKCVFSRLPHYDLLMFLAILQKLKSVHFLELAPSFKNDAEFRGSNTLLHSTRLSDAESIVFKRIDPQARLAEKEIYKTLITELVTHEHAVIRIHPNIHHIYGIAWEVHPETLQVLPVIAFEKSRLGDLEAFLTEKANSISFMQKLHLCLDIGSAIENLHSINVVLGDIKPKNILVFQQGNDDYVAKIIDFGCSSFGLDEQDSVVLSRTRGWEAPEYRRGTFTVSEAKKYDIYLYGKVCLWALFGQELDVEEFLNPSSEAQIQYDLEAVAEAFQRSEGFQSEFWDTNRAMAKLLEFFQATLTVDEREREGRSYKLLDQLQKSRDEFFRQQKQRKKRDRIRDFLCMSLKVLEFALSVEVLSTRWVDRFDNMAERSTMFALYRVDYRIRKLWLNRVHKNLSLGSRQIIFILAHSILLGPTALSILFWWAITIFVFTIYARVDPKLNDVGVTSRWGIIVPLIMISSICVFMTGRFMASPNAQFMYHCFQEYRDSVHAFSLLWTKKHMVPTLPQLMPLFNRLHYQIRVQIVCDLRRKVDAVHGCGACRPAAALQLALCHEVAFGVPRDTTQATKGSSFGKLLGEVRHYDRPDRHRRRLEILYPGYFDQGIVGTYNHDHISNALTTKIYQAEIRGKEETGLSYWSLPVLWNTLGDLSVRAGRYKGAEGCYRKVVSLTQGRYEGYPAIIRAYSVMALALLLEGQGRRHEAIVVHQASLPKPSMPITWEIDFSILLTRLRIAERHFDLALRADFRGILAASQRSVCPQMDQPTFKSFCETLPMALLEEGRVDDSIRLQRQIIEGLAEDSSTGDSLTEDPSTKARRRRVRDRQKMQICLTMLDGNAEQVREVSSIVAELREAYGDDDILMLTLEPIEALLLTKQGVEAVDVLSKLKDNLEAKEAHVSRMDSLTLGCMNHLADTLTLLLEENEPLLMHFSLHDLCTRMEHFEGRISVISLMVTMTIKGCFDRSINMIDTILDAGFLTVSDLLIMQCHKAFILSTQGLAFENLQLLEKAMSTVNSVKSDSQIVFEGNAEQTLLVERTFASVLSKVHMYLRTRKHENRSHHFQMSAIQAHTSVVHSTMAAWGENDKRTIRATERLVVATAGHDPVKAEKIYEKLLTSQHMMDKPAAYSLKRTFARLHDTSIINVTEFYDLEKLRSNQFHLLRNAVKVYGEDHLETMLERISLANINYMLAQFREAEALAQMVRLSWSRRFGQRHQGLVHIRQALFLIHRSMGINGLQLVAEISELYYFTLDVLGSKDRRHPRVMEVKTYLDNTLANSPFVGDEGFIAE